MLLCCAIHGGFPLPNDRMPLTKILVFRFSVLLHKEIDEQRRIFHDSLRPGALHCSRMEALDYLGIEVWQRPRVIMSAPDEGFTNNNNGITGYVEP